MRQRKERTPAPSAMEMGTAFDARRGAALTKCQPQLNRGFLGVHAQH